MTALDRLIGWFVGGDLLLFCGASFIFLVAVAEAGFRLGRAQAARHPIDATAHDGVGKLTAGMLSLLAFTLALTISFAQNRFESRRDDIVREANALGTAWLRAGIAAGEATEDGVRLAAAIRDYATTRLAYARAVAADEPALHEQTAAMQKVIWTQVAAIVAQRHSPITNSLVVAVNDMFDAGLVQRFRVESRVPVRVIGMLLVGSVLCFMAMGYQYGLTGVRHAGIALLLLMMWTGALLLIADFSNPREGALRLTTAPLVWAVDGMR